MATISLESDELRRMIKNALVEALGENRELLHAVISEALEDIALTRAMDEGLRTPLATREEVFEVLKSAK